MIDFDQKMCDTRGIMDQTFKIYLLTMLQNLTLLRTTKQIIHFIVNNCKYVVLLVFLKALASHLTLSIL